MSLKAVAHLPAEVRLDVDLRQTREILEKVFGAVEHPDDLLLGPGRESVRRQHRQTRLRLE